MTPASPSSQDRILTVDALRGFALFGILYSHMVLWYTAGPLPQRLYTTLDTGSLVIMGLYGLLFIGKFFSFFSFLFGLSFFLQMKSFEKRNESFLVRYGWRILLLGIIGLIHHALWRGDILSIYAPLGFILMGARKLGNKALMVIGFILLLNIPTKIYEAGALLVRSNPVENTAATFQKEGEDYYNIVKNGSFRDNVMDNWKALSFKFRYQVESGRLIITLGFFLLGMYAGRKTWFENLESLKGFIKDYWKKISFGLLALLGLAIVFIVGSSLAGFKFQENPWAQWFFGLLYDFFNAGLTLFYISGLVLLMYRATWQKILYPLAAIGKMALTSYLLQTFFGLLLFYRFGFGLFEITSPALNALMVIAIFLFQVLLSKWWLMYFSYGPVEWLWRSLTFFKFQRILKEK